MVLKTSRLELFCLTLPQLSLWVDDLASLERELCCTYRAEPMEGFFLETANRRLERAQRDELNALWHSFWLLLRKADRVVVGAASFKNLPNQAGEVEIGYSLGKEFEHNGYMTEAVQALCDFALRQNGVSRLLAETELDGLASQRILQRCGFSEQRRGEPIWWQR
ncbi:MAG: GNAT family N-acetyltransferase [Oscillospiraceae bacterium]